MEKLRPFAGDVTVLTNDLDREKKSFYVYKVLVNDMVPTGRRGTETVLGQPNESKLRIQN